MSGLAALLALALAAASENPDLAKGKAALRGLEPTLALRLLEQARTWPRNGPGDLAEIELYTGLAHAALAEEEQAVASFRRARTLEPSLELPPGSSPRIARWWEQAAPPEGSRVAPPAAPVKVAPAMPAPVEAPEPARPRLWARWLGLGALLAGAVVGGFGVYRGLEVGTLGARAQAEPRVAAAEALLGRAGDSARWANVLMPVGAVLLVGGAFALAFSF
ncbi:MAG: hypothetical protein IPJ65_22440 [Archangiaceae bacterium]|nr:hypothetical protein [Archangiaceae bacterium]